jgi:hypothetical protein
MSTSSSTSSPNISTSVPVSNSIDGQVAASGSTIQQDQPSGTTADVLGKLNDLMKGGRRQKRRSQRRSRKNGSRKTRRSGGKRGGSKRRRRT